MKKINKNKNTECLLYKRARRISLRTRLVLSFLILIISSATATIFIGNAVFGTKVMELSRSKVEIYLKVVKQVYLRRTGQIKILARSLHSWLDSRKPLNQFLSYHTIDIPIEFTLVIKGEDAQLHRFYRHGDENTIIQPKSKTLDIQVKKIENITKRNLETLSELADIAQKENTVISGIALLNKSELRSLNYRTHFGQGMVLIAASPSTEGETLITGVLLNNRRDNLVTSPEWIALREKERDWTTLFLYGTRIATTLEDSALGTLADETVIQKVINEGEPYIGIARVVDKDFYTAYSPLKDFKGNIVGMLGTGTHEAVHAEIKNRTTKLFSSLIIAGMIFGFIMTYLFSALLVKPVAQLAEGMHRVARGDLNYKIRIESADELGKLAKAFNIMVKAVKERDIRLREMTEERLSHVEKQVSIGRLAAGIAHEINNPLTAVLSLSSLMLKHLPEDDARREDLDVIVTETTRCREIVRSLLDFARERLPSMKVVDINDVIHNTVSLTSKYEAMEGIRTILKLSENQLLVNADSKQLQQVLTNLIINAAEATNQGGSISISSDEDSSGGFVVVKVQDTGKGINKEHINRVFEPFFTNKGSGKGTGLGLSVSLGIVRKHNGSIEIDSAEGKGTTVTLFLPRSYE